MMKVQAASPDNVGFADSLDYPNEQKIENSSDLSSTMTVKTPSTRRSFFKPTAASKKDAVASPSPSKQTVTTTVVETATSGRPNITVTKPVPKPGFIVKTVRKSKTRIVNGQKVTEVTTTYIEEPFPSAAATTNLVKKMPPRSTSSSNSNPASPTAHPTKKNHGWGRKILKTFGKKKKGKATKMPLTPLEAVPETVEQEEESTVPPRIEKKQEKDSQLPHFETTSTTPAPVSNQKQQPPTREDISQPKEAAPSLPSMFSASFPTRPATTARVAPKALALPSRVPTKLPVVATISTTTIDPVPPSVCNTAPAPSPEQAESKMVPVPVLGSPAPPAAAVSRPVLGAPVIAPTPTPAVLGAPVAPVPAPAPVHVRTPAPALASTPAPVVQLPVPVPDNDQDEYDEDEYEEVVTYYVEEEEVEDDAGASEYDEITILDDDVYDIVYYEEETVLDDSQHSRSSMQQHFAARPTAGPTAAAPIKMEGMELLMANIRAKVPAVH